jgi:hypothetical protein
MGQQIKFALLQSVHRVLVTLASFLPGLAAFLLAIVLFTLVGIGLAAALRQLLAALRFDERVARWETRGSAANVADWSPSRSPSLLMARVVLWICIFAGIAVGVTAFDASYAPTASVTAFVLPYLAQITTGILLMLIGSFLARFLERSVLIGAVNAQLQYARFLSLGVKWLVLVLTAAMTLDHLHIGGLIVELAFGILFGGIVLTLALAIGIGSHSLVSRSIEKGVDRVPASPTQEPSAQNVHPIDVRHF